MLKLEFDGVIDMKIREVNENKKQFIALLLLADEQENMIDHYLEKVTMYVLEDGNVCLLYTSPSPRDRQKSRMPSSA